MVTSKERTTVKIDKMLLEEIDELRKDNHMRIVYDNKKHFVNVAVVKLLEKERYKLSKK